MESTHNSEQLHTSFPHKIPSFKKVSPPAFSKSNSSGLDEPQSRLHHQSKENAFESVFDHEKQMELFAKLKTDDTLNNDSPKYSKMD